MTRSSNFSTRPETAQRLEGRRRGWAMAQSPILTTTITLDRLAKRGYASWLDY